MLADVMKSVGPTAVCPHPYRRRSNTVFVSNGAETMGLCGMCLEALKQLARRRASLAEVVREMTELGYTAEDAARFHADMESVSPDEIELEVAV